MNKTVVTKGEYAALKNRKPSAVSNWIADGRISRSALLGEGHRARIWVEKADADLARFLDPAQQVAQASPIAPTEAAERRSSSKGGELRTSQRAEAVATAEQDLVRRRKAEADKAEYAAEAARRRLAIDGGRWIDAAIAQQEWGREIAKLLGDVETFIAGPLARELADKYGLDWKAISVEARRLFRLHRGEKADEAAAERSSIGQAAAAATEEASDGRA